MAKKTKVKKKSSKQLKALRELHNIVTSWTDKDFEEKGPFSDYCYTQRKKNGFGKEFYINGEVDYEGFYIDGEKSGKGKEYFFNNKGKLKFEGEYLKGKRHGFGKEYNYKGDLIFEGQYQNGEKFLDANFI